MLAYQASELKVGQRVRTTDTRRRATILEISQPFYVALLQFDNSTADAWWPLISLEALSAERNGSGS